MNFLELAEPTKQPAVVALPLIYEGKFVSGVARLFSYYYQLFSGASA